MILRIPFALVFVLCLSHMAAAGVVLTWEIVAGGEKGTTSIYFDNGRVRIESQVPDAESRTAFFDGETGTLRVLRKEQHAYTEVTLAAAEKMWLQSLEMAKRIHELAAAAGQESPGGQPDWQALSQPGTATAPITLRSKESASQFGSWTCSNYEVLVRDKPFGGLCLTPFDKLHLTAADAKSYRSLTQLGLHLEGNPASFVPPPQSIGLPIQVLSRDASLTLKATLVKVEEKPLDPSVFLPPADFKKIEAASNGPQSH